MIIICFVYVRSCLPLRAVRELERMRKHKATNTWFPLNVIMPTLEENPPPPRARLENKCTLSPFVSLHTHVWWSNDCFWIHQGIKSFPKHWNSTAETYPSQLIPLTESVNLYRSLSALCLKSCECKSQLKKKKIAAFVCQLLLIPPEDHLSGILGASTLGLWAVAVPERPLVSAPVSRPCFGFNAPFAHVSHVGSSLIGFSLFPRGKRAKWLGCSHK